MKTQLGGVYRLQLQLFNADKLTSSSWLVGAMGVNYRQIDLIAVDAYSERAATVRVIWKRGAPGAIAEGDRIVPFMGDLPSASDISPYAVVTKVEELEVVQGIGKKIDYKLKLIAAVGMIAATAYFSMRIKKNVRSAA